MDELKQIIADNLAAYRKSEHFTQQQLAEKLNYSDKAISKWERGEGVPDVIVLKELADLYGITVNDFLVPHSEKHHHIAFRDFWAKRWLISFLSAGLVFLVATIVTVIWWLVIPSDGKMVAKYAFLISIPVALTILLVFSCVWGKLWMRCGIVSALIWTLCLLIYFLLDINIVQPAWTVFIIGAVVQVLVILWFILAFFLKRGKFAKHDDAE